MKNKELNIDENENVSIATRRDGKKYILEWIEKTDFESLNNVQQVYGFFFDSNGRLLIVNPKTSWRLPGGHPEEGETPEETLVRETDEEGDADITDLERLGYIKVTPLDKSSEEKIHYLLRYVGKIKKLKEQTEDIAIGEINDRELIAPEKFSDYIDWGKLGLRILNKAVVIKNEKN